MSLVDIVVGQSYFADLSAFSISGEATAEELTGIVHVTHGVDVGEHQFKVTVSDGLSYYIRRYGREFLVNVGSAFHECMEIAEDGGAKVPELVLSFDALMSGVAEE